VLALVGSSLDKLGHKAKAIDAYNIVKNRLAKIDLPEFRSIVSNAVASTCLEVGNIQMFQWFWVDSLETGSIKSQSLRQLSSIKRLGIACAERGDFEKAFHIMNYFEKDSPNIDIIKEKTSGYNDSVSKIFKLDNNPKTLPNISEDYQKEWNKVLALWSHAVHLARNKKTCESLEKAYEISGFFLYEHVKALVDIAVIFSDYDNQLSRATLDEAYQKSSSLDDYKFPSLAYIYSGIVKTAYTEKIESVYNEIDDMISREFTFINFGDFESTDGLNRYVGDFLSGAFKKSPPDHPGRFYEKVISFLELNDNVNDSIAELRSLARMIPRSGSFNHIADLSLRLIKLICKTDDREDKSRILGDLGEGIITEGIASIMELPLELIISEISQIKNVFPAV
jgi:hypothetical protein